MYIFPCANDDLTPGFSLSYVFIQIRTFISGRLENVVVEQRYSRFDLVNGITDRLCRFCVVSVGFSNLRPGGKVDGLKSA